MINQRQKKILIMALRAGELMMKSGAEIYRVEDTVSRICKSCGIPYVEVFATPTGIFASLDAGHSESDMHTFIKRIKGSSVDLDRISHLNTFSREFTTTDLSVDDGMERLKEIATMKTFSMPLRFLSSVLIASFFTLMIGGTLADFFCSALIGLCVYPLSLGLKKLEVNIFIEDFICCAAVALMALILVYLGPGVLLSPIIVGSLMMFLPGAAITNAIRDLLSGDMLAGLSRTAEAFLIAISIASGVGIVLKLWVSMGGVI